MQNWVSYKGDKLIEPQQVAGFKQLNDNNKALFTNFLQNFYKAWEFPEQHEPKSVKFIKKEKYLRVDFEGEWLHVTGERTWY